MTDEARRVADPEAIARSLSEVRRAIMLTQNEDFAFYTMRLAEEIGFPVETVKAECRALRDMGLLILQPAYCEDDGCFKGSCWFPRYPKGLAVRKILQEQDDEHG